MNIAVFLDGTWNEPHTNTNVIQLKERTRSTDADGTAQMVEYRAGVGSKPGERFRGGLFGYGLNEQIEEAYAAIARAYTGPEDRLYLVGYSRGAFSVRSLAGMIARCGIIREDDLPVERVFRRYRRGKASPRALDPGPHPVHRRLRHRGLARHPGGPVPAARAAPLRVP